MTNLLDLPIHAEPAVVAANESWATPLIPYAPIESDEFLRAVGRYGRQLPESIHDALIEFADNPGAAGALLVRGVPLGQVPFTPDKPTSHVAKDSVSEFNLLSIARRLGQPVGYLPEHGGNVVQNIIPVKATADRQVSTSSKVTLMFHTEAAFHPYRPRYLALLCLRGDRDGVARTTLASIREVGPLLDDRTRSVLFEPRFRTAADESYVGGRTSRLGPPMAVLSGRWDSPSMVFDLDLMQGVDAEASQALIALGEALASCHTGVVLDAGDLLIVDNDVAVHGRTAFTPRFDGLDRWLQRTFVVSDLNPSAADRVGRVIATRFEA
jgi:L-asparagine oxygenase